MQRRKRTKDNSSITTAIEPPFTAVWKILRSKGWKALRSRNLDISYRYTRPNSKGLIEGEDFAYDENLFKFACTFEDSRQHLVGAGLIDGYSVSPITKTYEKMLTPSRNMSLVNKFSSNVVGQSVVALDHPVPMEQPDVPIVHVVRVEQPAPLEAQLLPNTEETNTSSDHNSQGSILNLLNEALINSGDEDNTNESESMLTDNTNTASNIQDRDINILLPGDRLEDYCDLDSCVDVGEDEYSTSDECEEKNDPILIDEEFNDFPNAVHLDEAFINSLGGEENIMRGSVNKQSLRELNWGDITTSYEEDSMHEYAGLSTDVAEPIEEVMNIAEDPLKLFFYFLPRKLWIQIARESNRYRSQQLEIRVENILRKQQARHALDPSFCVETDTNIRRRLRSSPLIEPHEILNVFGLLIARVLCPQRRRMSSHWSLTEDGAVPAGTFGKYMSRARFDFILQHLHFTDNENPRYDRDKIRKIRPVVETLQDTFAKAWKVPPIFSFDEGMLPSTSSSNTTRQFIKDKPHRYGTKMFLTCDPDSAYCYRLELYVGKKQTGDSVEESFDNLTGAAAVVRNMKKVLEGNNTGYHAVVLDRFYSSVLLCIQLLTMSIYALGTVMPSRLGFDKRIIQKNRDRPSSITHGSFTASRCIDVPQMMCSVWWDRKPVHLISTGSIASSAYVKRMVKRHGEITVGCPKVVRDYHSWMGGVDVHDQLRLQRYSLQLSVRFKKYYKSLFMGLVDMALVNAFITFRKVKQINHDSTAKRAEFLLTLHNQLLQLKREDLQTMEFLSPVPQRKRKRQSNNGQHIIRTYDDWMVASSGSRPNGVQKRRLRSCKVCSLMRPPNVKKKSTQTAYYCDDCSIGDAKLYLCNRSIHTFDGELQTCFQIWHDIFNCGATVPSIIKRRIQLRRPSARKGTHAPRRRNDNEVNGIYDVSDVYSTEEDYQVGENSGNDE